MQKLLCVLKVWLIVKVKVFICMHGYTGMQYYNCTAFDIVLLVQFSIEWFIYNW